MSPGLILTLTDAEGDLLAGHISSIMVEHHRFDEDLFYTLHGLSHEQASWLSTSEGRVRPRLSLHYALTEQDDAVVADILEVVHNDLMFTEEYPPRGKVKVRVRLICSYRDGVRVDYGGPL